MEVIILRTCRFKGEPIKIGDKIDMDGNEAMSFIAKGWANPAEPAPAQPKILSTDGSAGATVSKPAKKKPSKKAKK